MNKYDLNAHCAAIYDYGFPGKDRKPIIGITANYGENNAKLAEGYYKQVVRAGGVPVLIPPIADEQAILSTLSGIDGLMLSGGADINPLYAGEQPIPQLGGINAERDLPELLITRLAYNRQMPILGICRGIQTLTVALGGKVAQDIDSERTAKNLGENKPSAIKHSQDADRSETTHTVIIERDSTLYNIYKDTEHLFNNDTEHLFNEDKEHLFNEEAHDVLFVNSFHHQAVSDAGKCFRVVARASDGVIEAIESTEYKPIIGVQWHPECLGDSGLPLFKWLVEEAATYKKVKQTHDRILTLDTHCDTPMFFDLKEQNDNTKSSQLGINFATRDSRILVDLPKMTEGRLDATIMVAYIPQKLQESAFDYANDKFDKIERIVEQNRDFVSLARTPQQLWENKSAGKKSIMMGIENGKALEGNLLNIRHFAQRGVVYITLCHNGDNDICDSAKGEQTHGGVSDFGEKVIREMNELGLMVDLSHAAEKSFYDALEISTTPIVCSHSSARALCDHPRNLTDEQMRALASKGGVCQITLYPGFLRLDEKATILDAMAHLDHAVSVMGIDHVGLGTDFDGDGGVCGLANAAELLNFTRQLLRKRYSEQDIQKIWGANFLRVMQQVQSGKR